MRLAIVGTRNPSISYEQFKEKLGQVIFYKVDEVISGGAVGIDAYAKRYAEENSLPLIEHLPDYETFGRRAPLMRNTLIVNDADRMIAFPSGESKGTYDSIRKMENAGKHVKIIKI